MLTLHEAHRTRRRMLGEQKLKEQLIRLVRDLREEERMRLVQSCERRSA